MLLSWTSTNWLCNNGKWCMLFDIVSIWRCCWGQIIRPITLKVKKILLTFLSSQSKIAEIYLRAERSRIVVRIFYLAGKIWRESLKFWQFSTPRCHKLIVLSIHWPHDLLLIQIWTHTCQVRRYSSSLVCCRREITGVGTVK